jgi:hypothetical protein
MKDHVERGYAHTFNYADDEGRPMPWDEVDSSLTGIHCFEIPQARRPFVFSGSLKKPE